MNFVEKLGSNILNFIVNFGKSCLFLYQTIRSLSFPVQRPAFLVQQIYSIGVRSLIIIAIAGFFVGMVLALQWYSALVRFGAESSTAQGTGLSLIRELGPVISALLFAGRASSALTAEIGLMKATEQTSGLEMMALNPMKWIVAPRFLASLICLPLLNAIFITAGILGGYLVVEFWIGADSGTYFIQLQEGVSWNEDVLSSFIKSIVFAFIASWVSLWQGIECYPTSQGISKATTQSVVHISLLVLGLDYLLTAIMF